MSSRMSEAQLKTSRPVTIRCIARSVRNPHAAKVAHQCVERNGNAAGGQDPTDGAIRLLHIRIGLAAQDDHEGMFRR